MWQASTMALHSHWRLILRASQYVVLANGTPFPTGCGDSEAKKPVTAPTLTTSSTVSPTSSAAQKQPRLLVFSKTAEYRHESIAEGVNMLSTLAQARGWG